MSKAFDIAVDALSSPQPAPQRQVHARHNYAKPAWKIPALKGQRPPANLSHRKPSAAR